MPTAKPKPRPKTKPATPRTQSKLNFGPAAKSGDGPNAKTPNGKKAPANGNILNFFKKVEVEEQLFCIDPANPAAIRAPHDQEDIYGGSDREGSTGRNGDSPSAPKRRKLSHGSQQGQTSIVESNESVKVENGAGTNLSGAEPPRRLSTKRYRGKGPFLADSDSEDDIQEESPMRPTTNGTIVQPIPQDNQEEAVSTPPSLPVDESCPNIPSPEPVLKQEDSYYEEFKDVEEMEGLFDDDEFDDGEEFRERRYMEEQARLELQAESTSTACPLCNASLDGISSEQATVHVNACLDGNPLPLPPQPKPPPAGSVEAPEVGKRFARAAVPRPGQANPISLGGSTASQPTSAFSRLMSGHAEDAAWASAAATEHASRGKPAYQRTCPFYKIMPGLSICVDAFRYGAVEGCNAYFLSHFHSDHYIGLTASWSHGPIYCSAVTASLIRSQLRTDAKYLRPLAFEETVEVPGTPGVRVTMIPANHCPGSSLFLFEKPAGQGGGRKQRILHCGDFRACPAHVAHPLLRPETVDALSGKTRQQKIDVCYLDTTYLNPRYSFPSQRDVITACAEFCKALAGDPAVADEAFDALRREKGTTTVSQFFEKDSGIGSGSGSGSSTSVAGIDTQGAAEDAEDNDDKTQKKKKHNKNKNRLLVVCGTYSIGKERICKAIAQALGTKIFASPAKQRLCRQLGDPELSALLTDDPRAAQVHMQMLMEIRADTLAAYLDGYRPHFTRVVGFRPSGWSFRGNGGSGGSGGAAGTNRTLPANAPPGTTVQTTSILHGDGWRPRFARGDLAAQRGSTRAAACFGVPYSEHSSFRELALFLLALRVERVVPTVNVGSEPARRRMKAWTDRWLAERRRGGVVRVLTDEDREEGMQGEGRGKEVELWEGKDGRGGAVWW
ncbi:DRMBL-domain-containing protein [Xylariomycetidae sp. FL0641]|nr:DRMBL-domain-containing protein [Xylariomycetidae sp. FL0641]